jgi:FixJ family two-component response regulator
MDLSHAELSAADFQQALIGMGSVVPVIFIATPDDAANIVSVMKNGAMDVLIDPFEAEALAAQIEAARDRDRELGRIQTRQKEYARRRARLTPREREVMDLVVSGSANKQVAAALSLSERTVEIHRARVMGKMSVASLAELVADHVTARSAA